LNDIRIPSAISNVIKNLNAPVMLIGCRANDPAISMPCCEYDIIVLSERDRPNEVIKIGSHWVEVLRVPLRSEILRLIAESVGGILLNDIYDIRVPSIRDAFSNNSARISAKSVIAKRLLISCLMRYSEIERMSEKAPVISAMMLKISAYEIIQSLMFFYGLNGSPLHQLEVIRKDLEPDHFESESISLALEIIGVERATSSVLRRSIPSYSRLATDRYDKSLTEAKIEFLYESKMIADCYYYVGKVCSDIVKSQHSAFWHTYKKLIQTGMDLSIDIERIQRWNSQTNMAAKRLLEAQRTANAG
jgi:hypothetical protein